MANFNRVILAGNLTRDPELRYTPKGTAIATFGLAINRKWKTETGESKEEVTFVDIDAFGRQAEVVAQYMKKGRPFLVEGRLKLDQWEDKNTHQKQSKLKVVLESFSFIDTKGVDGGVPSEAPRARPAAPAAAPARRRPLPPSPKRRNRNKTTYLFNAFDASNGQPVPASRHHVSRITFYSMAKTEVILTHNIVGLGGESDQVKVAAGYARNYLFPQGLAVPLTATNKRRIEALRQRRAEREAHELNTMTELSKSLSKLICVVTVKTGEDGKMFGTVTSGLIADQLKTQFDVTLDKRKIQLEHPIKALGEHEVELRLHADVVTTLKVRVESTTPPPALPVAGGQEGRAEDREARSASRSRR